jgi:hypothetical protein
MINMFRITFEYDEKNVFTSSLISTRKFIMELIYSEFSNSFPPQCIN